MRFIPFRLNRDIVYNTIYLCSRVSTLPLLSSWLPSERLIVFSLLLLLPPSLYFPSGRDSPPPSSRASLLLYSSRPWDIRTLYLVSSTSLHIFPSLFILPLALSFSSSFILRFSLLPKFPLVLLLRCWCWLALRFAPPRVCPSRAPPPRRVRTYPR